MDLIRSSATSSAARPLPATRRNETFHSSFGDMKVLFYLPVLRLCGENGPWFAVRTQSVFWGLPGSLNQVKWGPRGILERTTPTPIIARRITPMNEPIISSRHGYRGLHQLPLGTLVTCFADMTTWSILQGRHAPLATCVSVTALPRIPRSRA